MAAGGNLPGAAVPTPPPASIAPDAALGISVPRNRWNWPLFSICALLIVLVLIVFGQTIGHGFVNYDDFDYVYENPVILKGLSLANIGWAFTHVHAANWHPLTTILHMLNVQMYGLWAGGHHLTNVLIHAAGAACLFLILFQLTGAMWRSAFAAALFAIHPLRVESVAWVSELKDVLSGLFFMLTLWAYTRYTRRPDSAGRYAMVVLWLACGLMSKPMLVTVPFVLLLIDYWPLRRFEQRTQLPALLREKIPLLALSALSCVATVLAQRRAIRPIADAPFLGRIGNALIAYVLYIGKLIYPVHLAVLYPLLNGGPPAWQVIGAFLLLAALTAAAYTLRCRQPYLLVGWLWYLGMLVPVIGILQVGQQAYADRYTYLPGIGLCIAGTWTAADWASHCWRPRIITGCGALVVLSVLLAAAYRQTTYWRDGESLWTHTIACTVGDTSIAHGSLGQALFDEGRKEEAIGQFREAIQINPANPQIHTNLGAALADQGRTAEAIAEYREAQRIDPNYADAHYNLANALSAEGRQDEAIEQYHEALRIQPADANAHNNLGLSLFQQGRTDEAIAEYREAIRLDPSFAKAHDNLGDALLRQGRDEESIIQYGDVLRLDPNIAEAHNNLGLALFRRGRTDNAIAQYNEALGQSSGSSGVTS